MRPRTLRTLVLGTAAAASAAAAFGASAASAAGYAGTDTTPAMVASAYGVASGDFTTTTNDQPTTATTGVQPTPAVTSPSNGTAQQSVAAVNGGTPLTTGEVTVTAAADPSKATDGATSTVNGALITSVLSATNVRAVCSAQPASVLGDSVFQDLVLAGNQTSSPTHASANTVHELPGIGTLTLNEQTRQVVGDDVVLTVNAIDLRANLAQDNVLSSIGQAIIGHAVCRSTAAGVTSMSPASGPTAGGTLVTITGDHLSGVTGVLFGGKPGTDLVVNGPDSLTVRTPAHAAGSAPVTLVTPSGAAAGKTFRFIGSASTGAGATNGTVAGASSGSGDGGDGGNGGNAGTGNGANGGSSNSDVSGTASAQGALPHTGASFAPGLAGALVLLVFGAHLAIARRRLGELPIS
jgi:hypothetical protein